jgi:hypothetical protein
MRWLLVSPTVLRRTFWNREDVREAMNQILEFTKYLHPYHRLDVVPGNPDDNRVYPGPSLPQRSQLVEVVIQSRSTSNMSRPAS